MTFDEVLPSLARVCETSTDFAALARIVVVRDLRGRVRLVVEPARTDLSLEALSAALGRELGNYFAPPILRTDERGDEGRLARQLIESARPYRPSFRDPATDARIEGHPDKWKKLERRLSKHAWLEEGGGADPPWPLVARTPAIVTFYSFKGGVGRTTALVACAWQLAAQDPPRRVAVLDLDLEAPGLGSLLGVDIDRGVLDFIVDHLATESVDIGGMSAPARALGDKEAARIEVFPAGLLGVPYLDKLARLDFVASGPWEHGVAASPVEIAVRELLRAIRRSGRYDYILIDSRAGLHDLAGLSLHGLAHVDVLVGRATEQGYRGLDLTISMLARRRDPDRLLCAVVHSMAPLAGDKVEAEEADAFRARCWESFRAHVYEETPDERATDRPHSPWPIRVHPELERFASIGQVRHILFGDDYRSLRERVVELSSTAPSEET